MNDNDIWYSSTLGYEGRGTGVNSIELFNAIQRLLKTYAPGGATPSMMIGNKTSSFNADTQLTHIEQTFAVKIKESMVKVLDTALQAFFKESPLTKGTDTYRIFSQGQVPSVTKQLSYLTQQSAIREAQRETAGKMAQVYMQGGKPYITALGADQDEIDAISHYGFSGIIPSARSIQHRHNLEIIGKQRAAEQALLEKKQAAEAALIAKENAALVSSAERDRPRQDAVRQAYESKEQHRRYAAYLRNKRNVPYPHLRQAYGEWYGAYYGQDITDRAMAASDEVDYSSTEEEEAALATRKGRGQRLNINRNRKEDLRSAGERHRDNLRIFGKVAGGITLLVSLVSKILSVMGTLYKATSAAAVDTVNVSRTARNLGMSPFDLYRYSNLAIEKNLDKNIFTNAFSTLSDIFSNPISDAGYRTFENAGLAVVLGGGNINDVIANTFKGGSAEEYARIILDAYLNRYKQGLLLNDQPGSQEAVRHQLYSGLKEISPELAEIFSASIDSGAFSLADFMMSSRKGVTGYNEFDQSNLGRVGDAVGVFRAYFGDLKMDIFSKMASSLEKILAKVEGIAKWVNKDVRYSSRIDSMQVNTEKLKAAQAAKDRAKAYLTNRGFDLNRLEDVIAYGTPTDANIARQFIYASNEIDKIEGLISSGATEQSTFSEEQMIADIMSDVQKQPRTSSKTANVPYRSDLVRRAKLISPTSLKYAPSAELIEERERRQATTTRQDRKAKLQELQDRYDKIMKLPPEDRKAALIRLADEAYAYNFDLYEIAGMSKVGERNAYTQSPLNNYKFLRFMADQQYTDVKKEIEKDLEGMGIPKGSPVFESLESDYWIEHPYGAGEGWDIPGMTQEMRNFNGLGNVSMNLTLNIDGKKVATVGVTKDGNSALKPLLEDFDKSSDYFMSLQQS